MTEIKHGWVIESLDEGGFVDLNQQGDGALEEAEIYPTRKIAREEGKTFTEDRVRKVRIENGIAVEIIPGR